MSEVREARTWIITGASSGLGLALAEAALEAGARVTGTARRAERFGRLRGAYGGRLLAVEHDARRWAEVSESADFPGLPPAVRGFQRAAQ